jgi:hypothetical protein
MTVPSVTGTGGRGPASGASFLQEESMGRRAARRTGDAWKRVEKRFTQNELTETVRIDQYALILSDTGSGR